MSGPQTTDTSEKNKTDECHGSHQGGKNIKLMLMITFSVILKTGRFILEDASV